MMNRSFKSGMAVGMAVMMFALNMGRAQAALAPAALDSQMAVRVQDLNTVQTFLERKEVSRHLAGMNVSSSDIESRLNNLSDDELHHVAAKIQQQQPGRDGGGVVITVLVIGILALLFVYLLKRV